MTYKKTGEIMDIQEKLAKVGNMFDRLKEFQDAEFSVYEKNYFVEYDEVVKTYRLYRVLDNMLYPLNNADTDVELAITVLNLMEEEC